MTDRFGWDPESSDTFVELFSGNYRTFLNIYVGNSKFIFVKVAFREGGNEFVPYFLKHYVHIYCTMYIVHA